MKIRMEKRNCAKPREITNENTLITDKEFTSKGHKTRVVYRTTTSGIFYEVFVLVIYDAQRNPQTKNATIPCLHCHWYVRDVILRASWYESVSFRILLSTKPFSDNSKVKKSWNINCTWILVLRGYWVVKCGTAGVILFNLYVQYIISLITTTQWLNIWHLQAKLRPYYNNFCLSRKTCQFISQMKA